MKRLSAIVLFFGLLIPISVLAQTTAPTFVPAGGKWTKALFTDKLTGASNMTFMLSAEAPSTDFLSFVCKGNMAENLLVHTDTILDTSAYSYSRYSPGRTNVSYRSEGEKKIHNDAPYVSNNGQAFFLNTKLVSVMINTKSFVVRYQSASGNTVTDEFDTDGLTKETLMSSCQ